MEPPSYTPRSIEAPGLRPMDASTYSPRGQHGPDMVDLAPAAPWSCWSSEYQPPPPPAFASPVEAELALTGKEKKQFNWQLIHSKHKLTIRVSY